MKCELPSTLGGTGIRIICCYASFKDTSISSSSIDQEFEFEHNLTEFTFGFLIIHVPKNKVQFYRPLAAQIADAMERVKPGEVIHVRAN
jgi:hypothetical protein